MNPKRILIVDDEPDLTISMADLLNKKAQARGIAKPDIRVEHDTKRAGQALQHSFWHVVSMDLIMPTEAGRALDFKNGIAMARDAAKSGGLMSKLMAYSALLAEPDKRPREFARASAQLPRIDLYAKGSTESELGEAEPIEPLSPAGWAERVLDYISTDDRFIKGDGYDGGGPRLSAAGCWLQQAPKHLPTILARHATVLEASWDDPGTQRIDAALQFIEVGTRLAVAQTCALIEHSGGKVSSVPDGATMDVCMRFLTMLVTTYASELRPWTWRGYLMPVLPALDQARLVRNQLRHSLSPGNPRQGWSEIRPLLQAMMDLSGYWAQHPIWTELRYGNQGWTGERLAANQWPRQRREVGGGVDFDGSAVRGGAWQSAVRWPADGKGDIRVESFQWGSRWLAPDPAGRAWYVPMYSRSQRDRRETVTLDIDSGNLGLRPGA